MTYIKTRRVPMFGPLAEYIGVAPLAPCMSVDKN